MESMESNNFTSGDNWDACDGNLSDVVMTIVFAYSEDVQDANDENLPDFVMNIVFAYAGDAPDEIDRDTDEETAATKDYSQAVIYQIKPRDEALTDLYLGSSADFHLREISHRNTSKNPTAERHALYVNKFIYEHGGWDAWKMSVLEPFPCANKNELCRREGYWIKLLKPNLNKYIPGQTYAECYYYSKEYRHECYKKRYLANRDAILAQCRRYQKGNYQKRYEVSRQWVANNAEYVAERAHDWYIKNRESEARKAKERYISGGLTVCECGRTVRKYNIAGHIKTKIHKNLMEAKTQAV